MGHRFSDDLKVAIVHDWLPVYAGAERVLEQMLQVVPQADIYSLIDFLPDNQRHFLGGKPVQTSFLQGMPFVRNNYRYYLPLTPLAIEQFDMSEYELVVSSSYVVAKGVLTNPDQMHISYVHSPIRYAWDLYFQYLRQGRLEHGLRGMFARLILHYMRLYDSISANRVDAYIANSKTVAARINKTYRRRAQVVYPPVDTESFALHREKEDFYVTMSRLVPYKRVDLIVEAFSQMPDKELIVIGDGPEFKRIKAMAGPNVSMIGYQPDEAVLYYLQRAQGFVYAAEEDFGIVNVEAQACGTPVIAYGRGGATETIIPGETGVLFEKQSSDALRRAIHNFEEQRFDMDPEHIRSNAERFSQARFHQEFSQVVQEEYQSFRRPIYSQPGMGINL